MGLTICRCLFAPICQCLCSCFSCCGASQKVFARIGYVIFAVIWIILSTIFLYFGHYIFDLPFSRFLSCGSEGKAACIGISAVYRTSFALLIFHLILCLLCTCRNEAISKLNEGAWPIKFLFIVVVFLLSFFIPNGFFKVYGYCAMVISCIFMIIEMILLIDMAYSWNQAWVNNYDEGQSGSSRGCWCVMLILGTVVSVGVGLTIYILLMKNTLAGSSGTSALDWVFAVGPIVAAVVYFGLTIGQVAQGGSIFTCGLFFFFQSFITASGFFSGPYIITSTLMLLEIIIGLGFLFFVLFYLGMRTEKDPPATTEESKNTEASSVTDKVVNVVAEKKDDGAEVLTSEEEKVTPVSEKTVWFHLLMSFASLYYSMVLSNWGSPIVNGENGPEGFSSKWLAYGVIFAAQWIGILFFVWTLIAPRVCSSREFGA